MKSVASQPALSEWQLFRNLVCLIRCFSKWPSQNFFVDPFFNVINFQALTTFLWCHMTVCDFVQHCINLDLQPAYTYSRINIHIRLSLSRLQKFIIDIRRVGFNQRRRRLSDNGNNTNFNVQFNVANMYNCFNDITCFNFSFDLKLSLILTHVTTLRSHGKMIGDYTEARCKP